ncbi:hypothetical protein QJS10_CPA03g01094 [Acorus calamus]|uniref:Uncharacterized protein n=1 Tax=Acorus calamus TaxID=4465 RepID=A0AAV9F6A4_ACOCL|nr:hypothetical protein QJS10_CPA03g01094 [Acorus calamus]
MDNQGDENCFEFAFDNPLFSDRVLQIEVTDETLVDKQINSSTTKKLKKRKIKKKKIQEADENKQRAALTSSMTCFTFE